MQTNFNTTSLTYICDKPRNCEVPMLTPQHIANPEFEGLEKFVWEGLNTIGRTISQIRDEEGRNVRGDPEHTESKDKPIWHSKKWLDEYVANALGLKLGDYPTKTRHNPFYGKVTREIGRLRKDKVIIDWMYDKNKQKGMGIWRLDKTRLDTFVCGWAKSEMQNKNFRSDDHLHTVYVRAKQNAFRNELLAEYGMCALCGFKIPTYMIGAHIVPYSIMREEDPKNAMNPVNGLLLCRLCDVAFEKGSITVEADLGITISECLRERREDVVRSWIDPIPAELSIKQDARYPPDPKYLKWKKNLIRTNTLPRC